MSTELKSPMSASWAHRLFRSHWFVGILAVAEIILGFILLSFPYILGVSVMLIAGIVFSLMGVMRLIAAVRESEHGIWHGLCAIAYILLGVLMLLTPLRLMEIGTLLAGAVLMVIGLVRAIAAMLSRRSRRRMWLYLNAAMSFTLGLIVCATWPESTLWFLGVMVAIEMIFSGWSMLFLSISVSPEEEGDE